ncbi:hypothetical protein [uncultured Amnibacterium sp.]|uniref:hypothetical protein n=1 Tax=uncultured Amnibacterium sp. TaxID=1631851 RepID=UPI0035CBF2E3
MVVRPQEAGGRGVRAVDVDDMGAAGADEMAVVVADPQLGARGEAGGIGWPVIDAILART